MYKEASEIAAQLLEIKSTDVFFLEEVANIEIQLGNNSKALEHYEAILKIQPANTKALYNKAIIFLENKELEKALDIFKELHKDGDRDRLTIIYAGVAKCLSGNYEEAIEILTPYLSKKDVSLYDIDNQRGFIYLIYSMSKTQSPVSKIDEWFIWLDFELLKNSLHPLDEEVLAKSVLEIINMHFGIDKQDIDFNSLNYAVNKYIIKPSDCFTKHTKNILAEIWAKLSKLQKEAELFSDAEDSLKKATELSPDNNEYANMLIEATALYKKQKKRKKRKTVIITGSVITIAVLIILSVNLYNRDKENKAWEVANQENTYESYNEYLNEYPDNRFSEEAEYLKEKVLWEKAKEKNTLESYDEYLNKYWKNQGKYSQDAINNKEKISWKKASQINTLDAYHNFLSLFPDGKFSNDAKQNILYTDRRDGKTYKTVKIGNQIWMAENLNYATRRGSWCYENKSNNCDKYGRLYNWQTAITACPSGWHLPNDAEWDQLEKYLGGKKNAGEKLKSKSGWYKNRNSDNSSGFTALPGGDLRIYGFGNMSFRAGFWTSSASSRLYVWARILSYSDSEMYRQKNEKGFGFSVRCVRD